MKLNKYLLILTCALANSAQAEGKWYIAGSVGQSSFDASKSDGDAIWEDAGLDVESSKLEDTDTAYKLQFGYQFTPNFAIEGGYIDLGALEHKASLTDGFFDYTGKIEVEANGWNLNAVGIIPLSQGFSLFGKVGLINANVEATVKLASGGVSASDSEDDTDIKPLIGVGAAYAINDQLSVRAEFERFNDLGDDETTGKGDVDLLSAGVLIKF